MPPLTPTSPRLRFGSFVLDPSAGQLRKNDILIKLPPQPFRLLLLLAERTGIVVTREEIRNFLWADSTFVDFEHGINFSINQIRAALADDAEKPRYVETLTRRGYRFIAPVEPLNGNTPVPRLVKPVESGDPIDTATFQMPPFTRIDTATFHLPAISIDGAAQAEATRQETFFQQILELLQRGKWKWRPIGTVMSLTLLAVVFVYHRTHPALPRVVQIEQLTQSGRLDNWQRVTSDGSRLFFLEREGDHWDSLEVSTAGGESRAFHLPFSNANTKILAVSPDGSQFLVVPFVSRSEDLPLWVTPVVGGAPRRLGNLAANDATFSPDGKQIALANSQGIFITDLKGAEVRQVAIFRGENSYLDWSPDGKRLRFTQRDRSTGNGTLWEVTSDGRNLRRLFPISQKSSNDCCGRWTQDGSYFIYTAYHEGRYDLWAIAEPSRVFPWFHPPPVRLTSGPVSYSDALPSKDGRFAFASGGRSEINVFLVDPKTSQARLFLPGRNALEAGFSWDGQWVYYVTQDAIWRIRPDGSDRLQLVADSPLLHSFAPRWRKDSNYLLYGEAREDGNDQIYVVPAEGGPRRAILEPDHARDRPDWSPDGQTIVFSIIDQPRPGQASANAVYLHDLRNGQTTLVPNSEGLYQARWSPDGRFLAAVSLDSSNIQLYDFSQKHWREIARGNWMSLPVWSADSKFVYVQDLLKPGEPLSRFRIQDSSTEHVFSFDGLLKTVATRCLFLGLAPDGSYIVRAEGKGGNLYKFELDLP